VLNPGGHSSLPTPTMRSIAWPARFRAWSTRRFRWKCERRHPDLFRARRARSESAPDQSRMNAILQTRLQTRGGPEAEPGPTFNSCCAPPAWPPGSVPATPIMLSAKAQAIVNGRILRATRRPNGAGARPYVCRPQVSVRYVGEIVATDRAPESKGFPPCRRAGSAGGAAAGGGGNVRPPVIPGNGDRRLRQ